MNYITINVVVNVCGVFNVVFQLVCISCINTL